VVDFFPCFPWLKCLEIFGKVLTTLQRIQIRKLFQQMGFEVKPDKESVYVPQLLEKLMDLADRAGGRAPIRARIRK
jgi:hypothetical protein